MASNFVWIILGLIMILLAFISNVYLYFMRILADEGSLEKITLFGRKKIELKNLTGITKMKILGSVSKVPIAVSTVEFEQIDETIVNLDLKFFPYDQVIKLIKYYNFKIIKR